MELSRAGLGVGFYSRAEASRLLRVPHETLRRWVMGYTFKGRSGRSEQQAALIPPSLPRLEGQVALSFVDLIELRVVKALIERGLSLQGVRKARDLAQEHFPVEHPFASRAVYTPSQGRRKSVFIQTFEGEGGEDGAFIELTRRGYLQIQPTPLVEGFLEEIEFDEDTSLAHRWWPMGRTVPVTLDPGVAFGAPVVEGTGVRTEIVAGMVMHSSVPAAADAYQIEESRARAASHFEALLRA